MKALYIECNMGAAGDMLMSALSELIPDQSGFIEKMNQLGLPGVKFILQQSEKCGITGTHIGVEIFGHEEHDHHDHHGHHHHSDLASIEHVISHLPVSPWVRQQAMAVYDAIAQAESKVHGVPVSQVHFHEVGALDAVADVVGVCLLMEMLQAGRIVVSPIHVGSGTVKCAHGLLPVPAPATAEILKDVPIYGGAISGELCTPTGAALLKHFAHQFGNMPVMSVQKIGYGMGCKDFERANCVRAMLGEMENDSDEVVEICCNLDDMTGEAIGFAAELLRKQGALDVYTLPIQMKKNRPGIMLCCLCKANDREKFAILMLKHTTTIGVRWHTFKRYTLNREFYTEETPAGPVRMKRSYGYGIEKVKSEFDDISAHMARSESMEHFDQSLLKEKADV